LCKLRKVKGGSGSRIKKEQKELRGREGERNVWKDEQLKGCYSRGRTIWRGKESIGANVSEKRVWREDIIVRRIMRTTNRAREGASSAWKKGPKRGGEGVERRTCLVPRKANISEMAKIEKK